MDAHNLRKQEEETRITSCGSAVSSLGTEICQRVGGSPTVSVTEANSRITEYTRPLLLIVTFKPDDEKL